MPTPRRGRPAEAGQEAPRRSRRAGGETMQRVLWAIPWIAFAIAIVVIGELPFTLAMIGLAIVGLGEYFRMARRAHPMTPGGLRDRRGDDPRAPTMGISTSWF